MITSTIRKILAFFGLAIERAGGGICIKRKSFQPRAPHGGRIISTPASANFDNIALVMEHFTRARPGAIFVQIGANDGETSDSVNNFVRRGVLQSILIEPIPSNFSKLQTFYHNCPTTTLVNAAIDRRAGNAILYSVKDAGRWKDSAWATQLASFDKNHLIRHGINYEEIEEINVETLDFDTLLKRYNLARIDVLQIDVEGFDAEIVDMALDMPEPPLCICFEFIQFTKTMDQVAVDRFYDRLREKGYAWSHDRINTMAIHKSFIASGEPEPHPLQ